MRYIVADSQPHTAMVLRSLLTSQLKIDAGSIQSVHDSRELLESVAELGPNPAVMVLDVALPNAHDRLSMLQAVIAQNNSLKVVMYSTNASPFLVADAIAAGAAGYIHKDSSLLLLAEALRLAVEGKVLVDPAINMGIIPGHAWSRVTPQQRRILIALCKGTPLQEIANDAGVRYDSISRHKRNAMEVLGIRNDIEILAYLHQNGLTYLLDS